MHQDDELITEIAPDVLKALASRRFFEALDDHMCPTDSRQTRASCDGKYTISATILRRLGFAVDDIADIIQVLASRGGCCDCEILYNVADESRLKSEHWKAKATEGTAAD